MWRDGDSITLIDTGAPGSAAELRASTGAPVLAGTGDAAAIRAGVALPPPVFEEWELPIYQRVSATLPATASPPVPVDQELVDVACAGHGEPITCRAGGRMREVAATLVA